MPASVEIVNLFLVEFQFNNNKTDFKENQLLKNNMIFIKKIFVINSGGKLLKDQQGTIFRPEQDYYEFAGILLVIGCLQYLLAVNLAETLFPGYSIYGNTLSDLGGTIPAVEPSAIIFNLSIILLGILFLTAVYLIVKSGGCRFFSSGLAISAICIICVGLFPEYTLNTHLTFSWATFIFISLTVLSSYRLGLNVPMIIISIITGLIALITFLIVVIGGSNNIITPYLGGGGTERIIVYPVVLYILALGGYLSSRGKDWVKIRS